MTLFTVPVAGQYKITYGYVPGVHNALDFAVPVGTPVLAAGAGIVKSEGDEGALGDTIEITHTNGYTTKYGNMTSYGVSIGQQVSGGQQIGTSGGAVGSKDAGDSTGPHLPFQVWKNGLPMNPAPLLGVTVGSTGSGGIEEASSTSSLLDPFAGLNAAAATFGTIGSWLGNSGNWVRIGLGTLGGALLLIAIIKLLDGTQAGQAVNAAAKTAAKTALLA